MRTNLNKLIAICLACVIVSGLSSPVRADVINFESDSPGYKPNGWQSVDSSLVSFFDSTGENLKIDNYHSQSHGQALAVAADDPSYLIMKFSVSMNSLSLEFGNDDPGLTNPGDEAILTAYLDNVFVGDSRVVMNRDDIMNQTISISGVVFNQATFLCNTTRTSGLAEIVDNIQFIPEPATICMLGLGALSLLRNRRFR
jgi:hypothetical protein